MSGPVGTASKRPTKRGSHFSDKQIAQTVKDGNAVDFTLLGGSRVQGWVFGMDDYHWGVVDASGGTHLIHKAAAAKVSILDATHMPRAVQDVVGPFRDYVTRTFFSQTVQSAS
jgi:hypothetical protein